MAGSRPSEPSPEPSPEPSGGAGSPSVLPRPEPPSPSELQWIRSHVERCLQQVWGTPDLPTDRDGDYLFRHGTAIGWVRVLPGEPTAVQVVAHAAEGVRRSARLFAELNEVQGRSVAALFWDDGIVVARQFVSPHGLTPEALDAALQAVGGVADHVGPLLASVHGGRTPFPAAESAAEERR